VTEASLSQLSAGGKSYETAYHYDAGGRLDQTTNAVGTIRQTTFDALGRPTEDQIGTSPAALTTVTEYTYDGAGIGNGDLTSVTQKPGGGAANRVTRTWFDWRDRPVATKAGWTTAPETEDDATNRPLTYDVLDGLGRVVEHRVYDGDGLDVDMGLGFGPTLPAVGRLRALSRTKFDARARAYQTTQVAVDQSSGATGTDTLVSQMYFDNRDNVIATKSPSGVWDKAFFDGAGRATDHFTTNGAGGAAQSVEGDEVLTQVHTDYDEHGNPFRVTTDQRRPDNGGTLTK
jgi:YD repeat-containing protein